MVILLVIFVDEMVFGCKLELFGDWFGVSDAAGCTVVCCHSGRELVLWLDCCCFVAVLSHPSCCCLFLLWLLLL